MALSHPDKPALIVNGEPLSYQAWSRQIGGVVALLDEAGLHAGERVGICMGDKRRFLGALVGGIACGLVAVPLPEPTSHDFEWHARDAELSGILCDPVSAEAIRNNGASPVRLLEWRPEMSCDWRCAAALRSEDPAVILYTSGTTSSQKSGVLISHGNLNATATYMNQAMRISPDIIEYVMAPIHHAFGLGRCRLVLQRGGTLVFDDGVLNPARALKSIRDLGVNSLSGVSTAFALLIDNFGKVFRQMGDKIRWVEIGSLPLSPDRKASLLEILPNAAVFMEFGLTEAMRSTLIDMRAERLKIASVGRAAPGTRVRITDNAGRELAAGEVGDIEVSGPHVALGYWKNMPKWQARFRQGWIKSGDQGYLDSDGYLFFVGRKDDLINVGGEKFSPLEVEDSLREIITGRAFCVCGVNDPRGRLGDVPVLCIVGEQSEVLNRVRQHLKGKLPDYKIPRHVHFFKELPATENGKIKRQELRARLESQSISDGTP